MQRAVHVAFLLAVRSSTLLAGRAILSSPLPGARQAFVPCCTFQLLVSSERARGSALLPLPAAGTSWKSGTDLGMHSEMRTRTGGQMCCAGWTEQALRWAGLLIEPAARLRCRQGSPGSAGRGLDGVAGRLQPGTWPGQERWRWQLVAAEA